MSEDNKIAQTIPYPPDGPLVLTFTLYYKDGSCDHTRRGQKLTGVRLPDGTEHSEYALTKSGIPGVLFVQDSHRTSSKHEESHGTLTIEPQAPLPLTLLVSQIDEYHPDYYNEQGLSWEERSPTIKNQDLEIQVVAP